MNEEPPRPSGLPAGSIAPIFEMNLENLLEEYDGVLIDFFRGNW